jgi:uncharacterized small protein (DUF1192 family)
MSTEATPDNADLQIQRLEEQIAILRGEVEEVRGNLAKNTEVTQEVADLLGAAKGAFRVLDGLGTVMAWVGRIALGALAVWGLWSAVASGGRPPGARG